MGSGAYDLFLSYSDSDGDVARDLNTWLTAQGVRTFFDRNDLPAGFDGFPDLRRRSRAPAQWPFS